MMYSIVVPVYNEVDNIEPLYSSLKTLFMDLQVEYEIIFVDDGSNDGTFDRLLKLSKDEVRVKVIRFRRRFGQSAALTAGFEHVSGDMLISMDGDLQNDPRDIPRLIAKLAEGYDVVCGWRKERKDPFFRKKLPSLISNWVASRLSGLKIHDFGCTLRAYRKTVAEDVFVYGELHRHLPAFLAWKGYRISELVVTHNPRRFGKTKYGARRLIKGTLDLISTYLVMKYFSRPMHLFGMLGILLIIGGISIGGYLSVLRLIYHVPISERPLLLLAILMTIFGAQFLASGLIGEMLARIRFESNRKVLYHIERKLNLPYL